MNISATLAVFKLFRDPSLCLPQSTISTFHHLPIPLSTAFGKHKPDIRAVVLDKDNCFAIPRSNQVYPSYHDTFQRLRATYPGARLLIVSNSAGTDDDVGYEGAKQLEKNTGVEVLRHSKKADPLENNSTSRARLYANTPAKKPATHPQIMAHFAQHPETGVTSASQVAIVGDRLMTDVVMGNSMGAWNVWVRDGVVGPIREEGGGRGRNEGQSKPDLDPSFIQQRRGSTTTTSSPSSSSPSCSSSPDLQIPGKSVLARLETSLAAFLLRRGYTAPIPSSSSSSFNSLD